MSEPFLGEIKIVGFNFAPRGWSTCAGQILSINQYQALFSLLGTTFGGDGRTTFGLPDLRSRSAVGGGMWAQVLASTRFAGAKSREPSTLAPHKMPSHSHTYNIQSSSSSSNQDDPQNHYPALSGEPIYANSTDTHMATMTTNSTGSGSSFRNPYLGLFHCIAVTGLFPSRN